MSLKSPSVTVLVSAGRNSVSGQARGCRGDAIALAIGRKIAGDSLRVVHAGKPDDPALLDYLAYGAGRIDVLTVAPGENPLPALLANVHNTDLILTGSRAEQGLCSGLLPYTLAHELHRPVIADVLDVEIASHDVVIRQFMPKGKRRKIATSLPAVLAIHPLASAEVNYAYARSLDGHVAAMEVPRSAPITSSPQWTIETQPRRAIVLKAPDHKDGHARMLEFVESKAKGGAVAFDGSPVDKAQILLTYLRDHRLVDF